MNFNLPFFSYGVFKPGEISFLGINEFVEEVEPLAIRGTLVLRDGLTLFKEIEYQDDQQDKVDGFLISFKDELSKNAYEFINKLEPPKLLKWIIKTTDNGKEFNILIGVKPDRGSENIKETNWTTIWEDPFFTSAMLVLKEIPTEDFAWDLKPLFKLQMKYMLLWTILERFTFLRYSMGEEPVERNKQLSTNTYFKDALHKFVNDERSVFRADNPECKETLNKDNPNKSIKYYYQLRCNITHRGKAVVRDYDIIRKSYDELFNILEYLLGKTKEECKIIKSKYEK